MTEYLTPDEVADLLRVNRKTVYQAIRDGRLPALNVGGIRPVFRISRGDLDLLAHSPENAVTVGRRRRTHAPGVPGRRREV